MTLPLTVDQLASIFRYVRDRILLIRANNVRVDHIDRSHFGTGPRNVTILQALKYIIRFPNETAAGGIVIGTLLTDQG